MRLVITVPDSGPEVAAGTNTTDASRSCCGVDARDRHVPRDQAVAGPKGLARRDALSVDEGTVGALEIGDEPALAFALQDQVVPGEASLVGVSEVVVEGAADRDRVAIERHAPDLFVAPADAQLAEHVY